MYNRRIGDSTLLILILLFLIASLIWVGLWYSGISLPNQSIILDIAVSFATIISMMVAGYWAYRIFVRKRIANLKLNVQYELVCMRLQTGQSLIKVFAILHNIGEVEIQLSEWRLLAERVLPLPPKAFAAIETRSGFSEREAVWRAITSEDEEVLKGDMFEKFLEPGEIDRAISNLIIPVGVDVVQIYSHFKTKHKSKPRGWPMQTLVDLRLAADPSFLAKEITMPGTKIYYTNEDATHDPNSETKQETERETDRIENVPLSEQEDDRDTDRGDEGE